MFFTSLEYYLFLPIAFIVYWLIPNSANKIRNIFLILISYLFYGWIDYRFTFLLFLTSLITYLSGLLIFRNGRSSCSKIITIANVVLNILVLAAFKYYNFFCENIKLLSEQCGLHIDDFSLNIILPIGISFYTFMAISYTIDVYKRKFENYPSSINFFAYLSFFPHLLAGPIDRGRLLIPQFEGEKTFDYRVASDGVRQIIWGLFKKIVIADGCAGLVNVVWSNFEQQNSLVLLVTAVFYSIQIYSDFSGYSDIAIGTAHLFGINLMKNFGYPYFSRNVSEFWRKWHISLTSWFTEYIYIPLGGNRRGKLRTILNTLIVFSICGLWHGANWNFVFWGFLNGLLFIPLLLQKSPQKYKGVPIKLCFSDSSKMVLTFLVITFCWIFFRAPDLNQAFSYCFSIFANYECPLMFPQIEGLRFLMLILIVFIVVEWKNREFNHGLESLAQLNITYRWGIYLLCLLLIFVMRKTASSFIYFSF